MSCSVSRSGGTRSVFVAPVFGSVWVSVPFCVPERDGVDRDLVLLRVLDDVDRVRPAGARAVAEQHDRGRQPARRRRARRAIGTRAELIASLSASPIAVAPATCSAVDRRLHARVVGRRLGELLGARAEPDRRRSGTRRGPCPTNVLPAELRGRQARRLDVGRQHRARRVEHEHAPSPRGARRRRSAAAARARSAARRTRAAPAAPGCGASTSARRPRPAGRRSCRRPRTSARRRCMSAYSTATSGTSASRPQQKRCLERHAP